MLLFNVGADFFDTFLVSLLAVGWLRGIHFVNSNNKLFHTQSISQKGMLMGMPVLGDTGFKFTTPEAAIRTAQSAWDVPVIMFLMKSLCPGASKMVAWYLLVSNFHRHISVVIPHSRLAFSFSKTQAYLKNLSHLSSLLLERFICSLVDPATLVDQMASHGRLP